MRPDQEFFTARELAEIAKSLMIDGFPKSESNAIKMAKHKGWINLDQSLCRKRTGRGGGLRYHYSLLPTKMQDAIKARSKTFRAIAAQAEQAVKDKTALTTLEFAPLKAKQSTVMEARAHILAAIISYEIRHMASRGQAVNAFVKAQDVHELREAILERERRDGALTALEIRLISEFDPLTDGDGFGLSAAVVDVANSRARGRSKTIKSGNGRVARSTIYEWFKLKEERGINALAPKLTKLVEDVPPGFSDFLSFYGKPGKPAMTEALEDYMDSNPEHPLTIDQVRYTLRKKFNDIERNVGREGLLTLRSRMAYISRSTENLFPTTIYTADGKTLDAEVAHPVHGKPFKPEITSILDVATRRCVGFSISLKENVISVTEALRNACVEHGIPAIFYVDRGPGYKNKMFDGDFNGLMGRLSITKMHALPYNSQAKGIIERFNGTVWNPVARRLPTYLGESMDKEAASAVHKQTRRDIAQIGVSRLLPAWDDFRAMCVAAIKKYNARPHSGLPKFVDPETGKRRHMSPDEFWQSHVKAGFEPVPVDDDIKDDLFRPYEIRKVRRAIIEWNTNEYFHTSLEAWHGEQVMVGYDFADASKVWVRELDLELGQPGPLICVAEFAGNRTDYVPKTYQKKAEEDRLKGRLSRIERKRREIEAEASPVRLLDARANQPMEILEPAAQRPMAARPSLSLVEKDQPKTIMDQPRKRVFASDEELAAWALQNPESLNPNQVRVLRDCLTRQSAIELFRISGIDVDQLRNIIRAAA